MSRCMGSTGRSSMSMLRLRWRARSRTWRGGIRIRGVGIHRGAIDLCCCVALDTLGCLLSGYQLAGYGSLSGVVFGLGDVYTWILVFLIKSRSVSRLHWTTYLPPTPCRAVYFAFHPITSPPLPPPSTRTYNPALQYSFPTTLPHPPKACGLQDWGRGHSANHPGINPPPCGEVARSIQRKTLPPRAFVAGHLPPHR